MKQKVGALALVALVALGGCGEGGDAETPQTSGTASASTAQSSPAVTTQAPSSTTTTTAPSSTSTASEPLPGDTTYATVVELKDALVAAGYDCPSWEESNAMTLAAGSGTCSDSDVLSVYLSEDAKEEVIQNLKEMALVDGAFVAGPKWLLNAGSEAAAREWAKKLGATPVIWKV